MLQIIAQQKAAYEAATRDAMGSQQTARGPAAHPRAGSATGIQPPQLPHEQQFLTKEPQPVQEEQQLTYIEQQVRLGSEQPQQPQHLPLTELSLTSCQLPPPPQQDRLPPPEMHEASISNLQPQVPLPHMEQPAADRSQEERQNPTPHPHPMLTQQLLLLPQQHQADVTLSSPHQPAADHQMFPSGPNMSDMQDSGAAPVSASHGVADRETGEEVQPEVPGSLPGTPLPALSLSKSPKREEEEQEEEGGIKEEEEEEEEEEGGLEMKRKQAGATPLPSVYLLGRCPATLPGMIPLSGLMNLGNAAQIAKTATMEAGGSSPVRPSLPLSRNSSRYRNLAILVLI